MGSTAQSRSHEDYTIGWISALPLEMAAAIAILDDLHDSLSQPSSDHNSYQLGCIGEHNVVILCLPAGMTGKGAAATRAAQMLSTFKSIRFGLMVGIGGGVPSTEHDIRLGDVVVSQPTKAVSGGGGVVQYDFGKTIKDGQFIHTGSLNKPPPAILTAVSKLQATHIREESKLVNILADMGSKFRHPGAGCDRLFKSDYGCVDPSVECQQCEITKLIHRPIRIPDQPRIHYGVIASGDQVMKDGVTRDRLSKELGVLCFEMEAAGLMDSFPCLVIRGISDYADSHKNKGWQRYAAATAAAYAKEILGIISPTDVARTTSANREKDEAMSTQPLSSQTNNFSGHFNTNGGMGFYGIMSSGGGSMNWGGGSKNV